MENKERHRPALSLSLSRPLSVSVSARALLQVNTKNYAPMKISPMLTKVRVPRNGRAGGLYSARATRFIAVKQRETERVDDRKEQSPETYSARLVPLEAILLRLIIYAEVISITFARWRARHRLIRFTSEFAGERTKPRISPVLDTP